MGDRGLVQIIGRKIEDGYVDLSKIDGTDRHHRFTDQRSRKKEKKVKAEVWTFGDLSLNRKGIKYFLFF